MFSDEKPAIHEVTLMFCDYGNGRLRPCTKRWDGLYSTASEATGCYARLPYV